MTGEKARQKIRPPRTGGAPGRITITVAPLEKELRDAAYQMQLSKAEVIRQALSEFLERRKKA